MSKSVRALVNQPYKYGFVTDIPSESIGKGLNEDIIRQIWAKKGEPDFMLEFRLRAYRQWLKMSEPTWPNVTYPPIDYQNIVYYSAPKVREKKKSLDEVDPVLLETFEKLGIPLSEQKRLANVAVDAIFDSVSVATTFREKLAKEGIIFCSMSEALREYPELVRKYLGTVVPIADNYYAALNSAVFSDAWTMPKSSTRRCRTGMPATKTAGAASTTLLPSAASARGPTPRSPGRRWRLAPPSPGSIQAVCWWGKTRWASFTQLP
jgi:Fe-S cluster assembly protein SufB